MSCLVSGFETACTGSLLYSATGMGWVAESRVEPLKFYEEGFEEDMHPGIGLVRIKRDECRVEKLRPRRIWQSGGGGLLLGRIRSGVEPEL